MPGPLGCEQTTVLVTRRGGASTSVFQQGSAKNWSSVEWNRLDSAVAGCQVRVEGRARCEDWLSKVKPWRDELVVHKGAAEVWRGPVVQLGFEGNELLVDCKDRMQWMQRRVIHNNYNFGLGTDLITPFAAIIDDALSVDRSPNLGVWPVATGVRIDKAEGRIYLADNHQYAMDALSELARTGVSWTVQGGTVFCGPIATSQGNEPMLLGSHFQDLISVKLDGFDFGTRFHVSGSGGGEAGDIIYANNGPYDPVLEAEYGVVEVSMSENEVRDNATARLNAQQQFHLYGEGGVPTYVEGAKLMPNAPVGVNDLFCGRIFRISLLSNPTVHTAMRLTGVAGSVGPEHDWVSVTLEPVNSPIPG